MREEVVHPMHSRRRRSVGMPAVTWPAGSKGELICARDAIDGQELGRRGIVMSAGRLADMGVLLECRWMRMACRMGMAGCWRRWGETWG